MSSRPAAAQPEPLASHAPAALDADACYRAMKARDARFDGSFFTAVTSTGIYCRPVCRVTVPRRENCRFFQLAAQAEAAGFRPCLRCRPELAPRAMRWSTEDASRTLALQAMALIEAADAKAAGASGNQQRPSPPGSPNGWASATAIFGGSSPHSLAFHPSRCCKRVACSAPSS